MGVNGDTIYGSGPTPFGAEAGKFSDAGKDKKRQPKFILAREWRCTSKPGRIYLHIFKWPAARFELPATKSKITKGYLFADPKRRKLKVKQTAEGTSIALPDRATDTIASVVCLEIK